MKAENEDYKKAKEIVTSLKMYKSTTLSPSKEVNFKVYVRSLATELKRKFTFETTKEGLKVLRIK